MLPKKELEKLYKSGLSMREISEQEDWSYYEVRYWMDEHNIDRRSRSEASYAKWNPNGDPFDIKDVPSSGKAFLKGLGLGIFWGEGYRKNDHAVRVGNTNIRLIEKFIEFLEEICGVERNNLNFGLQIFDDMNKEEALKYWTQKLNVNPSQFYKVTETETRGEGTYNKKDSLDHGVLTVYFSNTKLKKAIDKMIKDL